MTIILVILILAIVIAGAFYVNRNRNEVAVGKEHLNKAHNSDNAPKFSKPVHERDLPADVRDALKKGQKLMAVKLFREHTGCSLAEAKAVIDSLS